MSVPERIWAMPACQLMWIEDNTHGVEVKGYAEYHRADLTAAAVTAALQGAADALNARGKMEQENFGLGRSTQNVFRSRDLVRAQIDPTGLAALEAVKSRVRAEALEDAAGWHDEQENAHTALSCSVKSGSPAWTVFRGLAAEHRRSAAAIRAMKEPGK